MFPGKQDDDIPYFFRIFIHVAHTLLEINITGVALVNADTAASIETMRFDVKGKAVGSMRRKITGSAHYTAA